MYKYLQGFKDHKLYDPLEMPGSADLTADVDFAYLKHCCGENGKTQAVQFCTCQWTIVFFDKHKVFSKLEFIHSQLKSYSNCLVKIEGELNNLIFFMMGVFFFSMFSENIWSCDTEQFPEWNGDRSPATGKPLSVIDLPYTISH